MAAEYISIQESTVESGQNILLTDSIPCTRGYVIHRNGSGILTLRGIVNGACNTFARYEVTANGNIAIATGGTVDPISIALSLDGEALQSSRAIITPAAVEDYGNVTVTAIVTVPKGCCYTVAIENISGQAILAQNFNVTVSRTA